MPKIIHVREKAFNLPNFQFIPVQTETYLMQDMMTKYARKNPFVLGILMPLQLSQKTVIWKISYVEE